MAASSGLESPIGAGITRRSLLGQRARSFVGMGLGGVLSGMPGAVALGAGNKHGKHFGRAKHVLVILEQGGLSHMDTWDPKPDAPAEHRSIYKPIGTKVAGMRFTELLAKTSKVADKLAVVRSMYHKIKTDDHPRGTQYMLSGEVPGGQWKCRTSAAWWGFARAANASISHLASWCLEIMSRPR